MDKVARDDRISGTNSSWTGLSTDNKPAGALQGAVWKSLDTGEVWTYNEGMWTVDVSTAWDWLKTMREMK